LSNIPDRHHPQFQISTSEVNNDNYLLANSKVVQLRISHFCLLRPWCKRGLHRRLSGIVTTQRAEQLILRFRLQPDAIQRAILVTTLPTSFRAAL
jgi:hypothetical protein